MNANKGPGNDIKSTQHSKRSSNVDPSGEGSGVAVKKAKLEKKPDTTKNDDKIWLNNKLVPRPNYPTSHGVLFYRKPNINDKTNESADSSTDKPKWWMNSAQNTEIRYLLGLIPQGNSWTVFKGLPENDEQPEETAIREFEEESSLPFPYDKTDWKTWPVKAELYGVTSTKKLLHIFLVAAPDELTISKFDVNKVVKIDSGRFSGVPEIIEIKFLTKKQAIAGMPGRGKTKNAKIYKSQISILERADAILNDKI